MLGSGEAGQNLDRQTSQPRFLLAPSDFGQRPAVWDHLPGQPLSDIMGLVGRAAAAIPVGGAPSPAAISTIPSVGARKWACSCFQHPSDSCSY